MKGYVEVSCGYKKVRTPRDPEICDNFIKALSEGPKNAKNSMDNLFGGMNPKDFVKEKRDQIQDGIDNLKKIRAEGGVGDVGPDGEELHGVEETPYPKEGDVEPTEIITEL